MINAKIHTEKHITEDKPRQQKNIKNECHSAEKVQFYHISKKSFKKNCEKQNANDFWHLYTKFLRENAKHAEYRRAKLRQLPSQERRCRKCVAG